VWSPNDLAEMHEQVRIRGKSRNRELRNAPTFAATEERERDNTAIMLRVRAVSCERAINLPLLVSPRDSPSFTREITRLKEIMPEAKTHALRARTPSADIYHGSEGINRHRSTIGLRKVSAYSSPMRERKARNFAPRWTLRDNARNRLRNVRLRERP